jgi:transposase
MGRRYELSDEEWERVEGFLPGRKEQPGVTARDNRLFINAVIWIARTGAPWRDLPDRFGKWNSVWRRFRRWGQTGVWKKVFRKLSLDADLEEMMLDSTVVRVHQHAAGALKKTAKRTMKALADHGED